VRSTIQNCIDSAVEKRVGTRVAPQRTFAHSARHPSTIDEEIAMNLDQVRGYLKQLAGRLKQRWAKRTGDTHMEIEGKRDELIGKIQEAYGIWREEAGRQARDRGRAQ
jgi:uncharacterized protein YjbJ (UPF0337 family)